MPDVNHLQAFFAQYPEFNYNQNKAATEEFYRMRQKLWPKIKGQKKRPEAITERDAAREGFKEALVMEFNRIYGTDVNNINNWRSLCRILSLRPNNWNNLNNCRTIVKRANVNLVDLVRLKNYAPRDGCSYPVVVNFKTERELAEYTESTEKFFPKEHAKAGGLLRFLLRRILSRRSLRR